MKKQENKSPVILAQSDFGKVHTCRCGGYHVSCQQTTLHFSKEGFNALRDLLVQAQQREHEACLSPQKKQGGRDVGTGKRRGLYLVYDEGHREAEEGS